MKAALFYGGDVIRVEEVRTPQPGPGEVLVHVRSAGICGSDLHGYRRPRASRVADAHQSGHELAGVVAALGPDVSSLQIGQRVGIEPEHLIGCGECIYCRRGDTHLCRSRGIKHGERHSSHGFSEYDVCYQGNVHPLPDSVSLDAAAILDCYACAVHAVHRAPVQPFATAVVIGTGTIGMNVGQVAKATGAGHVIMVGRRPEPLAIAREAEAADAGIDGGSTDPVQAVLDLTQGEQADVVFETVGGDAPTIDQAIGMARRGGTVCILGMFSEAQSVDVGQAYRKELTLMWSNSYSTWHGRSEYKIALDLLASGRVRAEPLLTHHFPLEKIAEAFATADDKRASGAIKVLVHSAD
ncbi:MAG TPA: zinc-binding dehydrogenase [Chloroflexota bacterium]|nr:zinc-binding dehydrogenase [Chloroflexota bacterium]